MSDQKYTLIHEDLIQLLSCFPDSYIDHNGRFIAHEASQVGFNLQGIHSPTLLICCVLEQMSRLAAEGIPSRRIGRSDQFQRFMQNGINMFLNTEFSEIHLELIYRKLGNAMDRPLTLKFIESGYDLSILSQNRKL